tara:strand:+ start:2982 stop:3725 length:744 start_codon:yes stop_codon:yes gene_type:complete
MGKVIVSSNQRILLSNGTYKRCKDLKTETMYTWKDGFKETDVTFSSGDYQSLKLLSTSQGKIIRCKKSTEFLGTQRMLNKISFNINENNKSKFSNYVQTASYLPVFGTQTLNKEQSELLFSSLFYLNNKRPNKDTRSIQQIPEFLCSLEQKSLSNLLNSNLSTVKSLDKDSKDILIVLLNRLGLAYNGKSNGRQSTYTSGTLCILDKCDIKIREEHLTLIKNIKEKSTIINSNKTNLLIGSILCLTS